MRKQFVKVFIYMHVIAHGWYAARYHRKFSVPTARGDNLAWAAKDCQRAAISTHDPLVIVIDIWADIRRTEKSVDKRASIGIRNLHP